MNIKLIIYHLPACSRLRPARQEVVFGGRQPMAGRSFIIRKSRGFTLIELMVALSITAILGILGIAGFVNYNETQVLQTSANEVVTMLNLAKSRAQSQIKPSSLCVGNDLKGYSVKISKDSSDRWWHKMYLNCSVGGDSLIDEQSKQLPASLGFGSSPSTSIFFPVQKGGVEMPGEIIISNSGGKTKTITINALGGVSVQ